MKIKVLKSNMMSNAFILFILICFLHLKGAAQNVQSVSSDKNDSGLILIPLNDAFDYKFQPLYANRPNGPYFHVLEGDPRSKPSYTVFRYSQNYTGSGKFHAHTHNYRLWLVEGALKHWDEKGSEETATVLTPGSYLYQPANQLHAANCLSKRCTAYVLFDGPVKTYYADDEDH